MSQRFIFSAFTKPWKTKSLEELAEMVKSFGFGGVEFPARHGYQIEPQDAEKGLPQLVEIFKQYDLKICSVASEISEPVFAGCAEAGIPLIRTVYGHDLSNNYWDRQAEKRRDIESYLPLCEKYGVKVGIQQHYGPGLNNTMELFHLLESYDSRYIGAVWDAAHSALAGEEPEQALDIIQKKLLLVNFRNAFYHRESGPEEEPARFVRHFTTGALGLSSWSRVIAQLKKIDYEGTICLPAEYTDGQQVEKYIEHDINYIKSLFNQVFGPGCYN